MKKSVSASPILAVVVAVSGCAPIEQVAQVPDEDVICRMESPIGSHVKEEDCERVTDDVNSDRDIESVFGDIVLERVHGSPEPAEGKCGSQ